MSEASVFWDTQRRVYDAMCAMRMVGVSLHEHAIVMHPAKWMCIRRDCPPGAVNDFVRDHRLFGLKIHLDSTVDEDYIALRHEVSA